MTVDELRWDERGLLPVVVQHARTGEVLTMAFADREALERTLADRETYLFSRSRNALWRKGETSGNVQRVVGVDYDCDADALLYRVLPQGPACHTGTRGCFSGRLLGGDAAQPPGGSSLADALIRLRSTIAARRAADPQTSYTARLLDGGVDAIAKKLGEEATEVVIAAKNGSSDELRHEAADLLYHLLVLLEERGLDPDAVGEELERRAK